MRPVACPTIFFFFNDAATTEIYTLSLHDALPICHGWWLKSARHQTPAAISSIPKADRKSTRLNSSHRTKSYAVFCLKKKKNMHEHLLQHLIILHQKNLILNTMNQ